MKKILLITVLFIFVMGILGITTFAGFPVYTLDLSETKTEYAFNETSNVTAYLLTDGVRSEVLTSGLSFASDSPEIFAVSDAGEITAKEKGISGITVTYSENGVTAVGKVIVACLDDVEVIIEEETLTSNVNYRISPSSTQEQLPTDKSYFSMWFCDDLKLSGNCLFIGGADASNNYRTSLFKYGYESNRNTSFETAGTKGWHQIAVIIEGGSWRQYLDGNLVYSESDFPSDIFDRVNFYSGGTYKNVVMASFSTAPNKGNLMLVSKSYSDGSVVKTTDNITYNFNFALDKSTVSDTSVILEDENGKTWDCDIKLKGGEITLDPALTLDYNTAYTVTFKDIVKGTGVNGDALLASDLPLTFNTEKKPFSASIVSSADNYTVTYENITKNTRTAWNVVVESENDVTKSVVVSTVEVAGTSNPAVPGTATANITLGANKKLYVMENLDTVYVALLCEPVGTSNDPSSSGCDVCNRSCMHLSFDNSSSYPHAEVSGLVKGTDGIPVFVYFMSEGSELSDITDGDMTSVLKGFSLCYTNSEGKYTLTENLRSASSEENYTDYEDYSLYVVSSGAYLNENGVSEDFRYVPETRVNSAVSAVLAANTAKDGSMTTVLRNNIKYLQLDSDDYESITNKYFVSGCVEESELVTDYSTIKSEFDNAVNFVKILESGAVNAKAEIIAREIELKGLGLKNSIFTEFTKNMNDTTVSAVVSDALKSQKGYEGFVLDLNTATVINALNSLTNQTELYTKLNDLKDTVGFTPSDSKNYTNLWNAIKNGTITDLTVLKNTYDALPLAVIQPVIGGGTTGNGTSGGGGGGSFTPSIKDDKEITVSKDLISEAKPDVTQLAQSGAAGFEDLSSVLWAKEAIMGLYNKSIINGRSETVFDPNTNVTREEFVKMAVIAFGITASNSKDVKFSDVISGAWYEEYIKTAYNAGIINGVSNDKFGTGLPVTRQDAAVIIKNSIGKTEAVLDDAITIRPFFDTDSIADYAKESVSLLRENFILNGVGGNYFNPVDNVTRAQAAKMLYEAVIFVEED